MDSKNRELLTSTVGIVCPTYNPDNFLNKLLPSVKHITELAPFTTWLINFNGNRWAPSSMFNALTTLERDFGFSVEYDYTGVWEKPVKILEMRKQCADMNPDCDLYLFIDDDFKFVDKTDKYPFTSGQRYLHSIDYMTIFPKCGVINTKSFLGGVPQKLKILPTLSDMYATNRGLFLRNMRDHGYLLVPPGTTHLRGGLEETLLSLARIELGYFCAKQMNNPTIHITGRLSDYDQQTEDFHNIEVINQNIGAYLRDRYDNWCWNYEEKSFPQKLWEMYRANGGLDIEYKDQRYTMDYAEYEGWDQTAVGKKGAICEFNKKKS